MTNFIFEQLQQPQNPRPASLTKPVELLGDLDLEAEKLLAGRVHSAEQKSISLDAAARLLMKARQGYQQVLGFFYQTWRHALWTRCVMSPWHFFKKNSTKT
jgi:hypothetical protein